MKGYNERGRQDGMQDGEGREDREMYSKIDRDIEIERKRERYLWEEGREGFRCHQDRLRRASVSVLHLLLRGGKKSRGGSKEMKINRQQNRKRRRKASVLVHICY